MIDLRDIENAAAALRGVVHETPLARSRTFSELAGCDLALKLENLQKTGSFKIRGAVNRIRLLTGEERSRGVIAASAGNHAQGVAWAATAAGIRSMIVMPAMAPLAKVQATQGYGADVVLRGAVYDEAMAHAREIRDATGRTMIHPFDDDAVIAGQGTIGLEILRQMPGVSTVVVPVGGGGLLAGVAAAIKEQAPGVRVVGVQSEGAPAVWLSLRAGTLRTTPNALTMADGIAVKEPGARPFELIRRYADDLVTVDDEETSSTILALLERSKQMVEGAGAVSLAAVLHGKVAAEGQVACVISGGNIDVNVISRIIERGLVRAGRRVRMTTTLDDRPGALQRLLAVIAEERANVIQVIHDRVERDISFGQTFVEVCLETRDGRHADDVWQALEREGYHVELISKKVTTGGGDYTG